MLFAIVQILNVFQKPTLKKKNKKNLYLEEVEEVVFYWEVFK